MQSDELTNRRLAWLLIGLAILGLFISLYLTWIKLSNGSVACAGVGDCEAVNNSSYSTLAGIPIAALGAAAYLVILGLIALEALRPSSAEAAHLGIFGTALAGTLYSAYLTYIELFVLHEVCPYCVVSAVCITIIFILSVQRLRGITAQA
jgi:uncharacterized membrane protein